VLRQQAAVGGVEVDEDAVGSCHWPVIAPVQTDTQATGRAQSRGELGGQQCHGAAERRIQGTARVRLTGEEEREVAIACPRLGHDEGTGRQRFLPQPRPAGTLRRVHIPDATRLRQQRRHLLRRLRRRVAKVGVTAGLDYGRWIDAAKAAIQQKLAAPTMVLGTTFAAVVGIFFWPAWVVPVGYLAAITLGGVVISPGEPFRTRLPMRLPHSKRTPSGWCTPMCSA